MSLIEQLKQTVDYIKSVYPKPLQAGIILGSGLGNLLNEIKIEQELLYNELPHFPVSTVEGHSGKIIFGELKGKAIMVMAGRFHFYEGYTPQQVTYPVRVMQMLGITTLLLSNAAGGVNTGFKVGDIMIIKDHISLFIQNPLIGKNENELGTRFPDMSEPYNKQLISQAKQFATELNIDIKEGVYCGVTGPTYETHAEYRLIKVLGGDAVGMSTVQEAIIAAHAGIKVFAVSIITDLGIRDDDSIITHEEVLAAAAEAEPKMTALFSRMMDAV